MSLVYQQNSTQNKCLTILAAEIIYYWTGPGSDWKSPGRAVPC